MTFQQTFLNLASVTREIYTFMNHFEYKTTLQNNGKLNRMQPRAFARPTLTYSMYESKGKFGYNEQNYDGMTVKCHTDSHINNLNKTHQINELTIW